MSETLYLKKKKICDAVKIECREIKTPSRNLCVCAIFSEKKAQESYINPCSVDCNFSHCPARLVFTPFAIYITLKFFH